jgi:hypothetical protein
MALHVTDWDVSEAENVSFVTTFVVLNPCFTLLHQSFWNIKFCVVYLRLLCCSFCCGLTSNLNLLHYCSKQVLRLV